MIPLNPSTSWCEKVIFLAVSTIVIILCLDYNFAILPIHGVLLVVYLVTVTAITTWVTFVALQKLLQHDKPFEYDLEHPALRLVARLYNFLHEPIKKPETRVAKRSKGIDERIEEFVKDVEVKFVLRWYLNISEDPSFPNECKALLDEVVRRFLQVVVEVDARKLVYGCVVVFLKHVKEFRKALKRTQKNNGAIEESYRYSHVGSKSQTATEQFIHHMTAAILRQFINWELWNSLPCRSLVSILSRRFTSYILIYLSAPGFLNYKIVEACASEALRSKLKLDGYSFISISDVDHSGSLQDAPQVVKKKQLEKADSDTPVTSPKKVAKADVADEVDQKPPAPPQEPQETAAEARPKASEPVVIYESKSANKTWRNSSDLECISLGQDLLAFQELTDPDSQIQELIEKKLWKDSIDPVEEEKSSWDLSESWFGEEDTKESNGAAEEVVATAPNFQSYLKSTNAAIGNVTASTLHNMKELQQTTVNTVNTVVKPVSQATSTAMHRIGDLQDEAAGMVEGILDFGMAGLRKGLRLTGLQENFSELTQKAKHELKSEVKHKTEPIRIKEDKKSDDLKKSTKLIKTPHVASEDKLEQSSSESDESVWINPLSKDSPSFDGHILLEKTPDSLPKSEEREKLSKGVIPQIMEDIVIGGDSPDPEYEETQDFASTIAKLRTLLQQKSSESGVTTPALSPMPQDEVAKTPTEPPPADLSKGDGAMPSLYKFCARTATGVFHNTLNTIKTALPGNVNESSHNIISSSVEDWTFVEADASSCDFYSRMKKLLSERRAFCTVDTAYEAIDSLDIVDQTDITWTTSAPLFDDEQDEFDLKIPITKALVDVICELIADTNTCLLQESVVKTILLFVGHHIEDFVSKQADSLVHNVNKCVGKLPENLNHDVMSMKLQEMVDVCIAVFPNYVKKLIGENTTEAGVQLFLNSLQSQRINQDIMMQMFELFTAELTNACGQSSPAYSA